MVGEVTDAKEIQRRESYIRANNRPYSLLDPFTWPYPVKGAGAVGGVSLVALHLNNLWYKKPFYYAIFPRLAVIAAASTLGYFAGKVREHHYATRDAVIEHYISLHPSDFDHLKEYNGRPFSQILLPWYPKRAQYTKYD